ncbi:Unknown protein [Striga hermonthica]|uniref:Reverse transcriptase zinc-binding domain-containing protein n=1 Tax=Striga hermonthica TaxID=68872 RepID=A0A9N7NGR6_STRHE|nr:Unknown protein [Striga hermonthica]
MDQRVHDFLRPGSRDRLFTNLEWVRRHMAGEVAYCYLCGQPESTSYVLRDCSNARHLWDTLLPSPARREFLSHELRGWIWSNFMGTCIGVMEEWTTISSITCWRLWYWRNMAIFFNKSFPLEAKIQDIRRRVERFLNITYGLGVGNASGGSGSG